MRPKLFIGSSKEGLKIAKAIQLNLDYDVEPTVWTQEVFKLSSTTIDDLTETLKEMDFGVFVFSPDDIIILRGEEHKSVRDNVIFELGLFVGRLGKERAFFLIPRGEENLHLPTDLIGVTPAYYDINRTDKKWTRATGAACTQILNAIEELGQKPKESAASQIAQKSPRAEEHSESQAIQEDQPESKEKTDDIFSTYYNDGIEKALSLIEKKIESASDDEEKVRFRTLKGYFKGKENLKEGIDFLDNLINEITTHPLPYIFASLLYQDNDLFDEAVNILDKGLPVVDDKEIILYNKAYALELEGKEIQALEILKELVEKKSRNSNVYLRSVEILERQGEIDEAEIVFQNALKLSPKNESVLYSYGQFLLDKNKNAAALVVFRKLTELFPQNSAYWVYLGNVYLTLELNGLALEAYQKGKELSESEESWIFENIGNIYKNRGFYPQAIKYLKRALELNPDSEYAHDRLATALKNDSEERKKADEILRKYKVEKVKEIKSVDSSTEN